MIAVG